MDQFANAAIVGHVVAALETLAGGFHAAPSTVAYATSLGCGAAVTWSSSNLSYFTSTVARSIGITQNDMSYRAGVAGRKAIALRSLNDCLQQVNIAGYEISTIEKQIAASKICVALSSKDIVMQQQQINQAREMEDFIRQKHSNTELHTCILGQARKLFYATYTQAFDFAKKVEKLFRFERPNLMSGNNPTLIQPGYWNASRDGLLAGENLYHALKQLQTAYMPDRGYDYEVTKNVSLRQLDSMALLRLRELGIAEFTLPEMLSTWTSPAITRGVSDPSQ